MESNVRTVETTISTLESMELMARLYEQSRRTSSDVPRQIEVRESVAVASDVVALPAPPEADGVAVADALSSRIATRFWRREDVPLAAIGQMLWAAYANDAQEWPDEIAARLPMEFTVVAWRVEGLERGVYRYVPGCHALRRIGNAPQSQAEREELVLQVEFTEAPFVVLITGNLSAACERHGAWGHRQLLMRSGAAGHRMWLAALGLGLVGTVFAGFIGTAARDLAGVDGYSNANLLAFSAGYEVSQ